jgi:hypothetical protein
MIISGFVTATVARLKGDTADWALTRAYHSVASSVKRGAVKPPEWPF